MSYTVKIAERRRDLAGLRERISERDLNLMLSYAVTQPGGVAGSDVSDEG